MKKMMMSLFGVGLIVSAGLVVASMQSDKRDFQNYFLKTFPNLSFQGFQDGPYAVDSDKRFQFESIMELPPFEDFVDKGEELWKKRFENGKTFASCFGNNDAKVRPSYPRWDSKAGKVVTLELAIQDCLIKNNEAKWGWGKGKMAYVSAYLTTKANGQKINVVVPNNPKAQAAYEMGKNFYYAKRGQLNLSCADCHITAAGKRIRGNVLSPALGQVTHFPVWRGKWARSGGDGFGTLHRRFGGCNKQVRAKPFKSQGEEYRNLEYFLTAMSHGMNYSGTAYRE